MSFFKKALNRMKRDVTGKGLKAMYSSARGIVKGVNGKGQQDTSAPPDKGPQFTDAARSQAAGAGTVGFTQRTQNW